ncbi:hypothetical protein AMK68_04195 [candidate division KD3-62 bacterium DG_56]|uniref:Signal peptidase I n=1 Tax=candidate division KD3-62 bacterium DG_56 TaxID=1704032 RepID=A0A0S7XLE1_9BACT|nr:MAG: hypothetical protein AMK68_04195 [candidate division KD3-62 bacterium DG_56]
MARWPSGSRARRQVAELLDSALLALGLMFVVIRPFVAQSFFIPSGSMEPSLQVGDWVLTNRFIYRINPPQRGDVVVFRAPERALEMSGAFGHNGRATDYIKRVVGLPGDWVQIRAGDGVYVNGAPIPEPYILSEDQVPRYSFPRRGEYEVPEDQLLVLGDNRNHSNDSHAWGPLPMDHLVGKAMVIFWPPTHLRWLN